MRENDPQAMMNARAEHLARSGRFRDGAEIEKHMRSKERLPVRLTFSEGLRTHLAELCAKAQAKE